MITDTHITNMEDAATFLLLTSYPYVVYNCYKFNRDQGVSYEKLKRLCNNQDIDAFEVRYQNETTFKPVA